MLNTRPHTNYRPSERFPIGGSRTLRSSTHDNVTLIGAGATVHEALAAADTLVKFGISARVIDLYSIQPLDAPTVIEAARETGNIIVAEDHSPAGGVGDAVLETLTDADTDARIRRLAVHTRPTSGRPEEHLWRSGIDRTWIATAARDLLEQPPLRPRSPPCPPMEPGAPSRHTGGDLCGLRSATFRLRGAL